MQLASIQIDPSSHKQFRNSKQGSELPSTSLGTKMQSFSQKCVTGTLWGNSTEKTNTGVHYCLFIT